MSPAQSQPALYLSKVQRRYPQGDSFLEVLRGADLAIWPGEIVALVAPSGTGKSTLLHVAGLLEKPDGGEVFVGSKQTAAMNDQDRTRVRREELGFVYQFHHLLPEFTALENVVIPQLIRGLPKPEAQDANAPRLLLADEPTGNLDPHTADRVFQTLVAIVRASKLAALIATHNMDLAARMDRRVTIRDGLIVQLP